VSLTARIARLGSAEVSPDIRRFLEVLAERDGAACGRLLDERAAGGGFVLAYWAPRMLAGTLSAAEGALLAVPAIVRQPIPRPALLRLAGRLGVAPSRVDDLLAWGLWQRAHDQPGIGVHPAVVAFAEDVAALEEPRRLADALLAADAQDELPPEALAELGELVLTVGDAELLADAAPRVIEAMHLADRLEDVTAFGALAADRLDGEAQALVLFAVAEALLLEERDDEAFLHLGVAAAVAPDASTLRASCWLAMAEIHLERAEGVEAGRLLAQAHREFLAADELGGAGEAATSLGALAIVANDLDTARDWLHEAIRLAGQVGDLDAVAEAYGLLGEMERAAGKGQAAHAADVERARIEGLLAEIRPDDEEQDRYDDTGAAQDP